MFNALITAGLVLAVSMSTTSLAAALVGLHRGRSSVETVKFSLVAFVFAVSWLALEVLTP